MAIVTDVRPILYDAVETLYGNNENMAAILDKAEHAIGIVKYVANVFLNVNDESDVENLKDDVHAARSMILDAVSEYWKEVEVINERSRKVLPH